MTARVRSVHQPSALHEMLRVHAVPSLASVRITLVSAK